MVERNVDERLRVIETALLDLKHEQKNGFIMLERELKLARDRMDEQARVLKDYHEIIWGDSSQEGLLQWRRAMDKRIRALTGGITAVGTAALPSLVKVIKEWAVNLFKDL